MILNFKTTNIPVEFDMSVEPEYILQGSSKVDIEWQIQIIIESYGINKPFSYKCKKIILNYEEIINPILNNVGEYETKSIKKELEPENVIFQFSDVDIDRIIPDLVNISINNKIYIRN